MSTDISGYQERIYVRDMVCRSRVQPFFSGARKNVDQERVAEIEPSGSIDWCTSEEVGHAPNCIMGQYDNMLQFTRSLMPFGAPERRPKIR